MPPATAGVLATTSAETNRSHEPKPSTPRSKGSVNAPHVRFEKPITPSVTDVSGRLPNVMTRGVLITGAGAAIDGGFSSTVQPGANAPNSPDWPTPVVGTVSSHVWFVNAVPKPPNRTILR